MSTIRDRVKGQFSEEGRGTRVLENPIVRRGLRMAISGVGFLIVWQVVAMLYFDPSVLPSPLEVATELNRIAEVGGPRGRSAWFHVEHSLVRVAIASAIGMSLALVLGTLMGSNDYAEDVLSVWLPFWMTVPTVVVVLISMVIFRFSEVSVIVAVVFAATPYAVVNTWKGIENVEAQLLEMADAFGLGKIGVWRHIYFPGILPSIFGSLRYLVGMVWKIVVLTEVFGMDNGMGAMFRFWYNQGSMVTLLAYLTVFVAVMFVIEYGVFYPVEQYLFRWRDA